jgi:hypothetical protein
VGDNREGEVPAAIFEGPWGGITGHALIASQLAIMSRCDRYGNTGTAETHAAKLKTDFKVICCWQALTWGKEDRERTPAGVRAVP